MYIYNYIYIYTYIYISDYITIISWYITAIKLAQPYFYGWLTHSVYFGHGEAVSMGFSFGHPKRGPRRHGGLRHGHEDEAQDAQHAAHGHGGKLTDASQHWLVDLGSETKTGSRIIEETWKFMKPGKEATFFGEMKHGNHEIMVTYCRPWPKGENHIYLYIYSL